MTQLLLALAMTMSSREVRPPVRWIPPPKPVMTLSEVVVRGKPFRHNRVSDCCSCITVQSGWFDTWSVSGGSSAGVELKSWVTGK